MSIEEAVAGLTDRWGGRWQVWYVPHAVDGSMTWCARRWDADHRHNLHAHTPTELEEYLTEAEQT